MPNKTWADQVRVDSEVEETGEAADLELEMERQRPILRVKLSFQVVSSSCFNVAMAYHVRREWILSVALLLGRVRAELHEVGRPI